MVPAIPTQILVRRVVKINRINRSFFTFIPIERAVSSLNKSTSSCFDLLNK